MRNKIIKREMFVFLLYAFKLLLCLLGPSTLQALRADDWSPRCPPAFLGKAQTLWFCSHLFKGNSPLSQPPGGKESIKSTADNALYVYRILRPLPADDSHFYLDLCLLIGKTK